MQSTIKMMTLSTLLVALIFVLSTGASPMAQSATLQGNADEERLPIGPDGSLFLAGTECGPNEQLAPGSLPTCEPTCENPRPTCPKVFFAGIDYVPCFCKSPLVRNTKTKQCVQLSECPRAST